MYHIYKYFSFKNISSTVNQSNKKSVILHYDTFQQRSVSIQYRVTFWWHLAQPISDCLVKWILAWGLHCIKTNIQTSRYKWSGVEQLVTRLPPKKTLRVRLAAPTYGFVLNIVLCISKTPLWKPSSDWLIFLWICITSKVTRTWPYTGYS
jgi:hypothetical protein